MGTIRTNDIVYVFNGGDAFTKSTSFSNDFDMQPWKDKCAQLQTTRGFMGAGHGVDNGDGIKANLASLMKDIRSFTQNRLDTIGQVCLLGRSAGCHLALALAAELNDQGITDLTFVGLSDVPMWDNGRDPPVPKVGAFKPENDPTAAGMHSSLGGSHPLEPSDPASHSIPRLKLSQVIKAKNAINLYQIQGNHTKYSWTLKRWIWWSSLSAGEVHGELDGFTNRLRKVSGNYWIDVDLKLHIELNTGKDWKAMCSEAAKAFADIPPDAP